MPSINFLLAGMRNVPPVFQNVFFPIYFVTYVYPNLLYALVLIINLIVDSCVVLYCFKKFHIELSTGKKIWTILKAWFCGFLADFTGSLIACFIPELLDRLFFYSGQSSSSEAFNSYVNNLMLNPYGDIFSLLTILVILLFSAWLIYILDKKLAFRKAGMSPKQRHKAALYMAVLTAPYLFLVPTILFLY